MPAPTLLGQQSAQGVTSTVVSTTGVANGNLMLMFVSKDGGSSSTITLPAGWTQIATAVYDDPPGPSQRMVVAQRIASSEPANYTVTSTGGGAGGCNVHLLWYSGFDTTTPINVYANQNSTTGTSPIPITVPSATTTVANTALVGFGVQANGASTITFTPPAGWTLGQQQDQAWTHTVIITNTQAAAGATGVQNIASSVGGNNCAFVVAIASPSAGIANVTWPTITLNPFQDTAGGLASFPTVSMSSFSAQAGAFVTLPTITLTAAAAGASGGAVTGNVTWPTIVVYWGRVQLVGSGANFTPQ